MERYVLIDHTADMMVKAFGRTLEECFGNAAYAMFDQTVDLSNVGAGVVREIRVEGMDDEDRLYVGEAYMYRTAQYLEECPNAEFLAWKGKDGYSLKAMAVGRLTEGPEFERMREMLERKNMRAVAVWVFKSVEVWDESASDTSGERILRWTFLARGRLSASSCFSPFSRRSQDWSSIPAGACSRGCFSS